MTLKSFTFFVHPLKMYVLCNRLSIFGEQKTMDVIYQNKIFFICLTKSYNSGFPPLFNFMYQNSDARHTPTILIQIQPTVRKKYFRHLVDI